MPGTLLDVIHDRFHIAVDPDSNGGQILERLVPDPPLAAGQLTGRARVAELSVVPTAHGVSTRAAQSGDAFVMHVPAGPLAFTILPADTAHPDLRVELKLTPLEIPLPFLQPARLDAQGGLAPATGEVKLTLPDLMLAVNASASPPASARLAPAQAPTDPNGIKVSLTPGFASLDPECVLGFGFKDVFFNTTEEPQVVLPNLDVFIAPAAIPALGMRGTGQNLRLTLGASPGLTGDLSVQLAPGEAGQRPRFLSEMQAHVILNRNAVTLFELRGKIGVGKEVHRHFSAVADQTSSIGYRLALSRDRSWRGALTLTGGAENFLWRINRTDDADPALNTALNTLGAYAVFAPLLENNWARAASLAGSQVFKTKSITLYGGELKLEDLAAGSSGILYLDLETEIALDINISGLKLESSRPVKVRSKALGIELAFGPNGTAPSFAPQVDHGQGFSLDLADPGLIKLLPGELGELFKPEGARIAQENVPNLPAPRTNLELDLVTKANLGVVTIDRAGVRVPLDRDGAPTLTALGAHLDAGLIAGRGYLKLVDGGVKGSLDIALGMLGVRGSASLFLQNQPEGADSFTAVMAALTVEWPVPIPLATSGVGLFGLLGLFAMHMERDQPSGMRTLEWFQTNVPQGDVTKVEVWRPHKDSWAFGAGAVLGTLEGGFLIHAKGMVMLELPGPRILIVMNADILSVRPGTRGNAEIGTFLALIEISEDSLTIAIIFDYTGLKPLLEVRIPVEAYFNFKKGDDWHLALGGIPPDKRATVKFLSSFCAEGYLLICGDGISDFPPGALEGFSVAVGMRAAFVWGSQAIGLYLKMAFQADIGIGFDPFFLAGRAGLAGELHLLILSIGVSASAEIFIADKALIRAEVCGKVEFLFFEVEGCVSLELGEMPNHKPAPRLARALTLHSRTPALLLGSATDNGADASLGKALHREDEHGEWQGDAPIPEVPIDAIPVLQMEMRPGVDPSCKFFEQPVLGLVASNPQPGNLRLKDLPRVGWLKRGESFYHYRLKTVELQRTSSDGAPLPDPLTQTVHPVTPVTWWDRRGTPSPGYDNDVQLALLTWQVDPTPAAAERTVHRDEIIRQRWGSVCHSVAPLTKLLWTFENVAPGPSFGGWSLAGTLCQKSSDPTPLGKIDRTLRITELWRTGNVLRDSVALVRAAFVFGSPLNEGRALLAPRQQAEPMEPGLIDLVPALTPPPVLAFFPPLGNGLRFDTQGMTRMGALLFVEADEWDAGSFRLRALDERGVELRAEPIHPSSSRLITKREQVLALWQDTLCAPLAENLWTAWSINREPNLRNPVLIYIDRALPANTWVVEIGSQNEKPGGWGLLAFEAITRGQQERLDFDTTNRENQINAIDGALHADQSKRALLRPDSFYTLTARYEVAVADALDNGDPDLPHASVEEAHMQQFRFKTQKAPPARLDSWILATDPAPAQNFFFYNDSLRVVFATNATRQLFAAYGCQLFAVAKPANGKALPTAKLPKGASFAQDPVVGIRFIPGLMLSAFDASAHEALKGRTCREFMRESTQHEGIRLTLPLEPLTDYILDMEAHDATTGAAVLLPDPNFPLYRLHFSTSRYASFNELAQKVNGTEPLHRWLENPAPLTQLGNNPPGNKCREIPDRELERALIGASWGDLTRADKPRVTIIWTGAPGTTPQPSAVLIETPEPHWRMRGVPQAPNPNATPREPILRYTLAQAFWLEIADPGPPVKCFVYSTAKDRTLIVLAPNARGTTLNLKLCRTHDRLFEGETSPPPADLTHLVLDAAPWEEEA